MINVPWLMLFPPPRTLGKVGPFMPGLLRLAGALVLAVTIVSTAGAGTYWVDGANPLASNSNPGTLLAPYKTIDGALSARAGSGTTINVKPGIYREQVEPQAGGSSSASLLIHATGGTVVVDGADDFGRTSAWVLYSGDVWLAPTVTWSPKQVFLDGGRLAASTAAVASLPVRSFRYVSGQGLYVQAGGGSPGAHALLVGRRAYGFRVQGKPWITIEGFTVSHAEDSGIYAVSGAANDVMRSDTLLYNARYGASVSTSEHVTIGPGLALGNGEHGVHISDVSSGTVQDFESASNGLASGPDAAGICLYTAANIIVQRCRVHHNVDEGMFYQSQSNAVQSLQNRSWANGGDGFSHITSSGTKHVGDVSWANGGRGFSYQGSTGAQMYDCIGGVDKGTDLWVDIDSLDGFGSSDNLWWNPTASTIVTWGYKNYGRVSDFSHSTGLEARSIQDDPYFVDDLAGDFRLAEGSPAIDSGNSSVLGWPATDAAGQARVDDAGTANSGRGLSLFADRGALEFAPAGTPPVVRLALSPVAGPPPLLVTADASGTTDPDGSIVSYRFDLGDGTRTAAQSSPVTSRSYGEGNWRITVRATDNKGTVSARSAAVLATLPPVAALVATANGSKEPLLETFDASGSSDADGRAAAYQFAYGDGSASSVQASPYSSHVYKMGTWTVTVTVTDNLGATSTASTIITVNPPNLAPLALLRLIAPYSTGFRTIPTSASKVFPEAVVSKPAYLVPAVDATFGTTVTRITGNTGTAVNTALGPGSWSIDARQHYAKDEPWNSDGTLISIDNDGGSPTRIYLDAETYKVRREICGEHRFGDDRWHPSLAHPHERISCSGDELAWIDVVSCVKTRSWPMPFLVNGIGASEGNPSDDGRYVALFDNTRVFVVDMDPQAPLALYPNSRIGPAFPLTNCGLSDCSVDWVSISPSGKYVVIKYIGEHMRVLDVDPATLALSPRVMPASSPRCYGTAAQGYVYDLGHLDMARNPFDNNEDVMVGQEHCSNRGLVFNGQLMGGVTMVRLKDDKVTSLTDPTNEAYAHHVSCRNLQRPGWAYVTYFTEPGKRFSSEIVAVKLDGSKSVQRFAQTHTDFNGCYRCEAHAVPSPDGRRVMWASNWMLSCATCGTKSDIKAYVADARALATPDMQPMAPYVVQADASGSTDADGNVASYRFDFGDGVTAGPQAAPTAPHTYRAGRWTLKTTITDNDGASSTSAMQVAVADTVNHRPVAALVMTPPAGLAPLAVVADASGSRDLEGPIASYHFDFGDGTSLDATTPTAAHLYPPGGWLARVIVVDAQGAADTAEAEVVSSPAIRDSTSSNLVANPSFVTDLRGWAGYGGGTLTRESGGRTGSYAARIQGPLTYAVFGINDSPNWVMKVPAAGTRYHISAWVHSALTAGRCRLQVREWLNGVQQGDAVFSPYVRLGTAWQQVLVDLLAFNVGSTIDVQVLDEPVLGSEAFFVDDVSIALTKSSPTLDYTESADPVWYAPRMAPNPMFRRGELQFVTARAGALHVAVFDVTGRRVRVLADDPFVSAGEHTLPFDAHDPQGPLMPAGLYYYRIDGADGRTTGRFVLAR